MPKIAATGGVAAFLFTDIEGSSLKWLNHRGAMQTALAAHDDILRKVIADHAGEVFKTAGDAFYAVFERPAAAVNAAISAQHALGATDFSAVDGLKVRMAAHFGTAQWRDSDYFGPALNRCARLLALGHGGQILVTASMAELIAAEREVGADLRLLGAHPLDDPMQPVSVYQVDVAGLNQSFPALRGAGGPATNLPQQLSRLIGREAELLKLRELIASHRLVTLTGSGGVGKTRLAIAAGAEQVPNFANGAWLAELAPLRDPSLVSSKVATSVGVGPDHNERGSFGAGIWLAELAPLNDPSLVASSIAAALGIELSDDKAPVDILAGRLRHQELLLILDNCEHVIDAVARLSETLLARCAGVRIIATSQEPLGIVGEAVLRLQTLEAPTNTAPSAAEAIQYAAVALFVERARTADGGFALTDQNAPTVAAICRRLDGIPLAIEMAAARAPTLGVTMLFQKLDQWFRLLSGGGRTAMPRHQTLRATLDWSHDLLGERERLVLRRLSVFAGGFTLETAMAVAADDTLDEFDAADAVALLAQKSLVAADVGGDPPRYHLMETTRDYAHLKLTEAGEGSAMSRRHAEQMLVVMRRGRAGALAASDAELRETLGPELDNTRAALDWAFGADGDLELGLAIAGAAEPMFVALALLSEGRVRLEAAAARITGETPGEVAAQIWEGLGRTWGFSHPARAFDAFSRALPLRRELGDAAWLGFLLIMMGRVAQVIDGRAEASDDLIAEAEPLIRRADIARLRGQLYRGQANAAANQGDFAESVARMRQAFEAFSEAGADAADTTETSLAYMTWASGDLDGAVAICRQVADRVRASRFPSGPSLGFVLGNLAGLLTERGDIDEAQAVFLEAVPLLRDPWQLWVIFDHLALCRAKAGRFEAAARAVGFTDAAYESRHASRQVNERRARASALAILAEQLDASTLEQLRSQGAAMTENDAVHIGLSDSAPR